MKDPVQFLVGLWKDTIELTSMVIPSIVLVYLAFTFKNDIHPAFIKIPDLSSNGLDQSIAFVFFVLLTLLLVIMIKSLSHDWLNPAYDRFYRNRRRQSEKTHYSSAEKERLFPNDQLTNRYEYAKDRAIVAKDPVVDKVVLLEWQSKLARTMCFVLILAIIYMSVATFLSGYSVTNLMLMIASLIIAIHMWLTFCRFRWSAGELLYYSLRVRNGTLPKQQDVPLPSVPPGTLPNPA